MSQQLVKKGSDGRYSNVMPNSWIEAIKDKSTGQTLVEILQGFNMYFLPYNGNTSATRCSVPMILRKKGLWITYVKYDGNVYTEWYAASDIDDKSWGDSSNWRIGNNTLVGDITISANGNWVINGAETEFKAVGEKGNTPLIRVANNRLQVSYDLGDTYRNVTENPVYTQFRNYNNKIQVSTDLGATWTDASDEIAAYFRWLTTTGDSLANNVGRLQISRDKKTWTNLSNDIINNLHISRYIGANESLPTSGIAEGTIYAKGPTYAVEDTSNSNPIYRLWVYAWKGNTLAWQDNGEFTSIAAGVVQETGNSETNVMSQKAVTNKFSELEKAVNGEESIEYLLEGYSENVTSGQSLTKTIVNSLNIPIGKSFFIKVSLTESVELSSWRFKTIAADGTNTNTDTIYQFGTWIEIPARDYVVTTLKWNSTTAVNTGEVRVDVAYITKTEGIDNKVKQLEKSVVNKQEKLEVGINLDDNATEESMNPITSGAVFDIKKDIEGNIIGSTKILAQEIGETLIGSLLNIKCDLPNPLTKGESLYVKVEESISGSLLGGRVQLNYTSTYIPSTASSLVIGEWFLITNTLEESLNLITLKVTPTYIQSSGSIITLTAANIIKGVKSEVEENTKDIYLIKDKLQDIVTDVEENKTDIETLASKVSNLDENLTKSKNSCVFVRNINLANDEEYVMDFKQYISKNMRIGFSCDIDSNFNSVEIGTIGYAASGNPLADSTKKYETRVVVDSNNIILWIKDSNSNYIDGEALPHGLTIEEAIQIRLEETDINTVKIILTCNGQQFETTRNYENWHLYAPYCKANGCSINNGVLSFTTIDINKDILVIGDSYTRYVDTRWVYYMQASGYGKNVILNGHSGAKTQNEGKLSVDNLIKICRPKYILWCLGMNDLEDDGVTADNNDGTINSKWIQGRDHLLEVCAANGITPVFTTIPSAYTHNNEAKNSWIRESGYQYVDFAKAVGAHWTGDRGVWRYGLRENETTGLHPSVLGAKVLWQQMLVDFPQIMCEL